MRMSGMCPGFLRHLCVPGGPFRTACSKSHSSDHFSAVALILNPKFAPIDLSALWHDFLSLEAS